MFNEMNPAVILNTEKMALMIFTAKPISSNAMQKATPMLSPVAMNKKMTHVNLAALTNSGANPVAHVVKTPIHAAPNKTMGNAIVKYAARKAYAG